MNAYELAKFWECHRTEIADETAVLLRQQADQIEQLKKEFDAMVMSFETRLATRGYEIQIKDQADQLADQQTTINFLEDECAALRKQIYELSN